MPVEGWVLATDAGRLRGMVSTARGMRGGVTVVAVGPRSVAEAAAAAGADAVAWIEVAEDVPAEAYASGVGRALSAGKPRAVLAAATPRSRALLGAAAVALGAVVIPGVFRLSLEGDVVVADRTDLGGRVVETVACVGPVAGLFGGEDTPSGAGSTPAAIERLDVGSPPADMRIESTEPVSGAHAGVSNAERVVRCGSRPQVEGGPGACRGPGRSARGGDRVLDAHRR